VIPTTIRGYFTEKVTVKSEKLWGTTGGYAAASSSRVFLFLIYYFSLRMIFYCHLLTKKLYNLYIIRDYGVTVAKSYCHPTFDKRDTYNG